MNAVNLDETELGWLMQRIQAWPEAMRVLDRCRIEPAPPELMKPDDSSREAQAVEHLAAAAATLKKRRPRRQRRWDISADQLAALRERAARYFGRRATRKHHQWDDQRCLECGRRAIKSRGLCETCYSYLYRYRPQKGET